MVMPSKVLPHDLDAEKSVLGAVFLSPTLFADAVAGLTTEDFYHQAHAAIWQAMVDLDEDKSPIDALTVAGRMRQTGDIDKLRAFNGEAYFAELSSAVCVVDHVRHYAKVVRTKATLRRLIETAQAVAAAGLDPSIDPKSFIEESMINLEEAAAGLQVTVGLRSMKQVLGDLFKLVEKRYAHKDELSGIPTGFRRLDALTNGWQAGHLILIAGRPGMGKTAAALAHVVAAAQAGVPVLMFSLEMTDLELAERTVSSAARVDSVRLRTGNFEQRDWISMAKHMGVLSGLPITICDSAGLNFPQIRALTRRWRRLHQGKALVVIDYVGLIDVPPDPRRNINREREVSAISGGCKQLAKEQLVPVLLLSQLNRGPEGRGDHRPTKADLRESGSLEQDADLIALLYRDEVYNPESEDKGIVEVNIDKNRHGPTGVVKLAFLAQYTRFDELAAPYHPNAPAGADDFDGRE